MKNGRLFQIGVSKTVTKRSSGSGTVQQTSLDLRILARGPENSASGSAKDLPSIGGLNQPNAGPTTNPKNAPSAPDDT